MSSAGLVPGHVHAALHSQKLLTVTSWVFLVLGFAFLVPGLSLTFHFYPQRTQAMNKVFRILVSRITLSNIVVRCQVLGLSNKEDAVHANTA